MSPPEMLYPELLAPFDTTHPGAGADSRNLKRHGAYNRGRDPDPYRRDYFEPDFLNGIHDVPTFIPSRTRVRYGA